MPSLAALEAADLKKEKMGDEMKETPRTDAIDEATKGKSWMYACGQIVEHARQLERELAAEKASHAETWKLLDKTIDQRNEREKELVALRGMVAEARRRGNEDVACGDWCGILDALKSVEHPTEPAKDVVNLVAHLERQIEWSKRTFGDGHRVNGVTKHIEKELAEIRAKPDDLTEWIDVAILAFDGAWRAGYSARHIADALLAKQAKNMARNWPKPVPGEDVPIEHVRDETEPAKDVADMMQCPHGDGKQVCSKGSMKGNSCLHAEPHDRNSSCDNPEHCPKCEPVKAGGI